MNESVVASAVVTVRFRMPHGFLCLVGAAGGSAELLPPREVKGHSLGVHLPCWGSIYGRRHPAARSMLALLGHRRRSELPCPRCTACGFYVVLSERSDADGDGGRLWQDTRWRFPSEHLANLRFRFRLPLRAAGAWVAHTFTLTLSSLSNQSLISFPPLSVHRLQITGGCPNRLDGFTSSPPCVELRETGH